MTATNECYGIWSDLLAHWWHDGYGGIWKTELRWFAETTAARLRRYPLVAVINDWRVRVFEGEERVEETLKVSEDL